jgi:uncharacterized membrane protein YccC
VWRSARSGYDPSPALPLVALLAGAAAGLVLLGLFPDRPWALVGGLAMWTGLCAGAGSLVRPFRGYGFALAGYTPVLLALPAFGHAPLTGGLFADRVLCTLLGVLSSAVTTALFTPRARREELDARLQHLANEVLAFSTEVGSAPITAGGVARQRGLFAELGRIGALSDQVISGFVAARGRRRKVREALRALLLLVLESRLAGERAARAEPPRPGAQASPELLPSSAGGDELLSRIRRAASWPPRPGAWSDDPADGDAPAVPIPGAHASPGSSSRPSVRDAALVTAKTVLGMALVAGLWWATGWRHGMTMVASASVFLTLFASNESARALVRQVLLGSIGGAIAAILYTSLIARASAPAETAVFALPFLLVGAWAMARPLTAKAAIDFNMVFLLATPPAFSLHGDLAETATRGLAIVVGVLAATIFFHATHETPEERVARLAREVVRDVRRLAGSADAGEALRRRSAIADRVVRMAIASQLDDRLAPTVDAVIGLLGLARTIERLVQSRDVGSTAAGQPVAAALGRIEAGLDRPSECAAALDSAADLLAARPSQPPAMAPSPSPGAVESLRDAARIVRRERALLDPRR